MTARRPGPHPGLHPGLHQDRRGAVALMVGVMSPMLLGILAITVDTGFWVVAQTRLQIAADAGAMGTSFLLSSSSFKAMNAATQQSTAVTVATTEARSAATRLVGTMNAPTVVIASDYSSSTVTVTSQTSNYFGAVFNIAAPLVRATATVSAKPTAACLLTLGTTGNGIQVDNAGVISASTCTLASKASIYLNSGTIAADKLVAAGTVSQSNSGSNSMSANSTAANSGAVPADSYSGAKPPTASSTCMAAPKNVGGAVTLNPGTWCGDVSIGGNGTTYTFNPGIYIVSEGDLTFNNATITSASGVSFVLNSSTAGKGDVSWTNNSNGTNAITAPTSGATAGMVIWQGCNGNNASQSTSFQGGSTLNLGGTVYAPCSGTDIGNFSKIGSASGSTLNLVTKSIYVHGSGSLSLKPSTASGSGSSVAMLTQ